MRAKRLQGRVSFAASGAGSSAFDFPICATEYRLVVFTRIYIFFFRFFKLIIYIYEHIVSRRAVITFSKSFRKINLYYGLSYIFILSRRSIKYIILVIQAILILDYSSKYILYILDDLSIFDCRRDWKGDAIDSG